MKIDSSIVMWLGSLHHSSLILPFFAFMFLWLGRERRFGRLLAPLAAALVVSLVHRLWMFAGGFVLFQTNPGLQFLLMSPHGFGSVILAAGLFYSTRSPVVGAAPLVGAVIGAILADALGTSGVTVGSRYALAPVALRAAAELLGVHGPVVAALWWWAAKRRRSPRDAAASICCSECRYDLRGVVPCERCPECGARFDSAPASR